MSTEDQVANVQAVEKAMFSEDTVRELMSNYRQGIMELKASRESLLAQLDEINERITRTEGAALALAELLAPKGRGSVPQQLQRPPTNGNGNAQA